MKKLISLILILCMTCMLIPAMAEDDILGDWYMIEMKMGDTAYNLADMGMSMMFAIKEDGTVTLTTEMMGEKTEQNGTWTLDGTTITITIDDQPQSGTFADGKIILEGDGQVGTLSKEAPVATEKAKAVAAESEDAFIGTWTLSAMDMMGARVTAEQAGYTGTVTIEAGKFTSVLNMGEELGEQTSTGTTKFEDGKLTVTIDVPAEQAELAAALGIDASTATVELLEDGSLLYSAEFMGMSMGMYLVPAEAAEQPAA